MHMYKYKDDMIFFSNSRDNGEWFFIDPPDKEKKARKAKTNSRQRMDSDAWYIFHNL